ncbi:hypothetical protein CGJ88_23625, partial [Vibrio parahaemolyticus]
AMLRCKEPLYLDIRSLPHFPHHLTSTFSLMLDETHRHKTDNSWNGEMVIAIGYTTAQHQFDDDMEHKT